MLVPNAGASLLARWRLHVLELGLTWAQASVAVPNTSYELRSRKLTHGSSHSTITSTHKWVKTVKNKHVLILTVYLFKNKQILFSYVLRNVQVPYAILHIPQALDTGTCISWFWWRAGWPSPFSGPTRWSICEHFDSSGFSIEGTLISASATVHCWKVIRNWPVVQQICLIGSGTFDWTVGMHVTPRTNVWK